MFYESGLKESNMPTKKKNNMYGWVHVSRNFKQCYIIQIYIFFVFDICRWITFSIYNIHNCKISR